MVEFLKDTVFNYQQTNKEAYFYFRLKSLAF